VEADADAELHVADRGQLGGAGLHIDRRLEREVGGVEHRHHLVAYGLDDAAAVSGDRPLEDLEHRFDCRERGAVAESFVERRAAAYVGEEDCEFARRSRVDQLSTPPRAVAEGYAAARSFFCCLSWAAFACIEA
jgi:hypothetical protein